VNSLSIEVSGVREAEAALRAFPDAVDHSFQGRLRDVARAVAAKARARASWSRKIPPGIQYSSSGEGATVEYLASAPAIGRLSELRDVWTHPLFGDRRHMYPQRGRPFLDPAAAGAEAALALEAEVAIEVGMKEVDL